MTASVVVTGLGVITASAGSVGEFADALREGRRGFRPARRFDTGEYGFHDVGEIATFASPHTQLDRASQLALEAARQARLDAGEGCWSVPRHRLGVVLGTTCGGAVSHESVVRAWQAGSTESPVELDEIPFQALAQHVAADGGAEGPVVTVTIACASGSNAVGLGAELIDSGQADVVLAGGSDTTSLFTFSGFSSLRAMTSDACRPFHKRRDGMVLGEGAACVVLERADAARRRGARVHAEFLGYGFCSDAYHSTAPDPQGGGLVRSIRAALQQAGLGPEAIDYVNAHGTGTAANDAMEHAAYMAVFGERLATLPVSSTKSLIGHTLGAAGAIELVACVLALEHQFVPPTANYTTLEPEWSMDVVPNSGRPARLRRVLCCNAGFAGNNTAVVLGTGNTTGGAS